MSDVVLIDQLALADGRFAGLITLNSEKTLNSLNLNMVQLIAPQLDSWAVDDSIAFVMFSGAGDRAFCAGGDVQSLYQDMVSTPGGPCDYCDQFFEQEYRLDYQIHTYPKPTVSFGHGIVMGGGLGIASACSHRIGTEKTRIAMPEITIGLIPDAGSTWSFMKMPEHLAHFLAWTGANINGADALHVNLVDYLLNFTQREALMHELANHSFGEDVAADLSVILADLAADSSDMPASQLIGHGALIERVVGQALASPNPVLAFAESCLSLGDDPWLSRAAKTFRAGCPTTAQIIVTQFKRARQMSLKETFMQELVLAVQCSRHPDFAEGVRALLIDKDNKPAWQHPDMGRVPQAFLDEHFLLPWDVHPLADIKD